MEPTLAACSQPAGSFVGVSCPSHGSRGFFMPPNAHQQMSLQLCSGRDEFGELGNGAATPNRTEPTVVAGGNIYTEVIPGGVHTFFRTKFCPNVRRGGRVGKRRGVLLPEKLCPKSKRSGVRRANTALEMGPAPPALSRPTIPRQAVHAAPLQLRRAPSMRSASFLMLRWSCILSTALGTQLSSPFMTAGRPLAATMPSTTFKS